MSKLNKEQGNKIIDKVDVGQVLGGSRSIKSMVWDVSLLDANEGIRFRGKTIPELQAALPSAKRKAGLKKGSPTPEATTWFLMTGEVPTEQQVSDLTQDLHERSSLPAHVESVLKAFPKDMHPMSQLVAAMSTLQTESKFAKKYHTVGKKELWEPAFEDALDVIAKAPQVAARIYNNTYGNGNTPATDKNLDLAANFNRMLGFPAAGKPPKIGHVNAAEAEDAFDEYMRLYLSIHTDHEGGNVSAHTVRLVGSALSDPYLSYAAGMAGLAYVFFTLILSYPFISFHILSYPFISFRILSYPLLLLYHHPRSFITFFLPLHIPILSLVFSIYQLGEKKI